MFDIGFPELVVVSIIALLVLGPERLPEALRTMGLWLGRLRRSFTAVKTEIEKEIGMDDIRRQLHNEAIMEEMERIEAEVKNSMDTDEVVDGGAEDNSILPRTKPPEPAEPSTTDEPASTAMSAHETPTDTGSRDKVAATDAADFANEPLTDIGPESSTQPTAEDKIHRADH